MTDAGYFRGTSADQDDRFANKQKKLLKEMNASPILNTKLNMSKINLEAVKPWIEAKIKGVLEQEDDLLSDSIYEHLAGKEPDGKSILLIIAGFATEAKATKFTEELWAKLINLQENNNGIEKTSRGDDSREDPSDSKEMNHTGNTIPNDKTQSLDYTSNDRTKQLHNQTDKESRSKNHSRSASPELSKDGRSPNEDDSADKPKKKLSDSENRDQKRESRTPTPTRRHSRSRSQSKSPSRSAAEGSPGLDDRRSSSRSHSKSSRSQSRSGSESRSRSRSRSRSHSKSRSKSPRYRRRSPYRGYRGRSSPGHSPRRPYRPESRSPIGRRPYTRGPYRGSHGFHDRRRQMVEPPRGRKYSPWAGGRRFSPRSPPRRRRTPSYSPRRRHSRSPRPYRRRSRSRSPPPHILHRTMPSPRLHPPHQGPSDVMNVHRNPQRDIPRLRHSPRGGGPVDQRGYFDVSVLPRRPSPASINPGKLMDPNLALRYPMAPEAPESEHRSSPSRTKHKKDKKHKKHKKHSSRRHRDKSRSRSETPDKKRKKHKKHKKTKKHK